METAKELIKLSESIEQKVSELGEELRNILSNSVCVGYSFYDTSIEKTSANGLTIKCNSGLRLRYGSEEIIIGAEVKLNKCIPQNRTKIHTTLDVEYNISRGRDLSFKVSDQINFIEGEHWDSSLYNIPSTKIIFSEVERMIHPLTLKSPMPLF